VKSEPPGPAFFRFQGVPRDPVLRPKSDPPYFWWFLTLFHVLRFHILCILVFFHFHHFDNFDVLLKCHIFWHVIIAITIRPYYNAGVFRFYTGGRMMISVVVLPSLFFLFSLFDFLSISCRGEYTG